MSAVADAMRQSQESWSLFNEISQQLLSMNLDGRMDRMDRLAATISAFEHPIDVEEDAEPEAGSMALLRAFDRHGAGLEPYAPGDAVEPDDVVIGSDRAIWIVDRLDEHQAVASVVGGRPDPSGEPCLLWRPSSKARAWIGDKQVPGKAYVDPDSALRGVAGLWGVSETETRDLGKPEALFWQLSETKGVKLSRKGLDDDSSQARIREWLIANGAFAAAGAEAMPGDLFWSPSADGFRLVLRAGAAGVDALFVNRSDRGLVGEPKGSAQIARATLLPADAILWRPG